VKPTLVTGATGFVGWHVAQALIEQGHSVRALVRQGRRVPELDVEPASGDLRDPESLRRAVAGCGLVFHVAADYRLWAKHPEELFSSNVGGTRNLLEAARDARAERVVYTSTVGCIAMPGDREGTESDTARMEAMTGAYKQSKFAAEQVALEFARAGLPVVIVNPTAPIGDHDFRPTPTGKILLDFLKGGMPAYVDTGLNLVDVAEVARGHLLAAEHGVSGERYILGSENLTLAAILGRLAAITGSPAPRVCLPYAVAWCAGAFSTGWANLTGTPPRVPLDGVKMARKKMFVSNDKARRELGFNPMPVDGALRRAVEWFRSNGYV